MNESTCPACKSGGHPDPSAHLLLCPARAKPSNKLKHPISDLIARLEKLPPGSTYEEVDGELFGGQAIINGKTLGTGYQLRINVVEGIVSEKVFEYTFSMRPSWIGSPVVISAKNLIEARRQFHQKLGYYGKCIFRTDGKPLPY